MRLATLMLVAAALPRLDPHDVWGWLTVVVCFGYMFVVGTRLERELLRRP